MFYFLDIIFFFYIGYKLGTRLENTFWRKLRGFFSDLADTFKSIHTNLRN